MLPRRFRRELNEILRKNLYRGARRHAPGKDVGKKTQANRADDIYWCFGTLHGLGYKVHRPKNFCEKHMKVLVQHMEDAGKAASTIAGRVSTMRRFAEWIGKPGMIKPAVHYARDPASVKRSTVAQRDKTWSGQGVDPNDKIWAVFQADKHVGIQLLLMFTFGMRRQEAFLLRPHEADRGTWLDIERGTKGNRPRSWPLRHEYEREVLELAKELAGTPGRSTIPPEYSLKSWTTHFYHVLHKFGISRKGGITPHGLRHERINREYLDITGHLSPIKGGEKGAVSRELDEAARSKIARMVGHSRLSIVSAYSGPKPRLPYADPRSQGVGTRTVERGPQGTVSLGVSRLASDS